MRSRLWALILRELPFPFREFGTEIVRLFTWLDVTAARIWLGFSKFPAWYAVSVAGSLAVCLTALLFVSSVSNHDPTIRELAKRTSKLAPITREHLEEAGDWAAQDKWRLAHMFVDHRPPRKQPVRRIDSRLVDDFPTYGPSRLGDKFDRNGVRPRYRPDDNLAASNLTLPETEVRLDLGTPKSAEQPKRLVYGPFVREAGTAIRPVRASTYRSRDSRLLVQAEWSQGSECDNELPRRPTRRIIPVPDPQWDELPPLPQVTDDRHPDLSFQMVMLREFLPSTAEFPPRSHLASVSAISEFPAATKSSPFADFALDAGPWSRTSKERAHPHRPVEAYADRIDVETEPLPHIDDSEFRLSSVPSFTEVVLRLEVHAPESATVGQDSKSSIVIRNDGLQDLPLVDVRESLTNLQTVTDAIPPAHVNRTENTVERRISHLQPGKEPRLELIWRPDSEGLRTHTAMVMVQAAVGATTEVVAPVPEQPMPSVAPEPVPMRPPREPEPIPEFRPIPMPAVEPVSVTQPGLSLDVKNVSRATVEDLVEIEIDVRNTGDAVLHDVRVAAQLPDQLKHRKGTRVEYSIDKMPVGGSKRTVLRVTAQSAGHAVCHLKASASEPVEAAKDATIDVANKPIPLEPAKITRKEPPRPKPAPATNCCCPSQPVAFVEGWFVP